jgi:RsmE family RNA methyltransferase
VSGSIILRFDPGMIRSRIVNLIVLHSDDFIGEGVVRLTGRRADHVLTVHRAAPGEALRVGLLNGKIGTGVVRNPEGTGLAMSVTLSVDPPPPVPVTLLLALPRPKVFRRVLQCVTSMGIKRIALFGAFRVEKSYWKSPWLDPDELRNQMVLGLEQACDTVLPEVTLHPYFKPFVEDVIPLLTKGTRKLVAHPGRSGFCPAAIPVPVSLAIGPEGGFTDYEIERLSGAGFEPVTLGQRILRTEQAVPALLGRLLAV